MKATRCACVIVLVLACCWLLADPAGTSAATPRACAPSTHHLDITSDETWCLAGSPHYVTAGISVMPGATLTIDPGVEVRFSTGASLNIHGGLYAVGNGSQPIAFTSVGGVPGDWAGLTFGGSTVGAYARLSYCDIAYTGNGAGNRAIYMIGSLTGNHSPDFQMQNCRIHHGIGRAVSLESSGLVPLFSNVEIDHMSGDAIFQTTLNMAPVYTNLNVHDNGTNAVHINGSTMDRTVLLDGSPTAMNVPIHLDYATVTAGNTLTVTAGSTVKLAAGGNLIVDGGLVAEGTPTLPISITVQGTAPVPGSWVGFSIGGSTTGAYIRLSYCDVAYAGQNNNRMFYIHGSLTGGYSPDMRVQNCRIHDGNGRAIVLESSGLTPVFENVEVDHFSGEAIFQSTLNMAPVYTNLNIHDNGSDVLHISGSTMDRSVILDGSAATVNVPIHLDSATVPQGNTLTVMPGTTLKFALGGSLIVNGGFDAQGTASQPITLTVQGASPASGSWVGLTIAGSTVGAYVRLANCDIGYAGQSNSRTFYVVGSLTGGYSPDMRVQNCRIHHGNGRAFALESAGLVPLLENLEIDHFSGEALFQSTLNMQPIYHNLTIHDNGTNALRISGTTMDRSVTLDGSPAAFNVPVHLDYATVTAGNTLTVTAGTTIKFNTGGSLTTSGAATLIAEGTISQPITLTSRALSPARGDWGGIRVGTSSRVRLAFCDIGYGGGAGGNRGVWISSADTQIHDCRIHNSLGDGIFIDIGHVSLVDTTVGNNHGAGMSIINGTGIEGVNVTLSNNDTRGANITAGGTFTLTNGTIAGNSDRGIYNLGTATVTASTIAGNAYGIYTTGSMKLKNTIVANSTLGANCSGTVTDQGGNLQYPGATCGAGITTGDPQLGVLQNNGGKTLTMALGAASEALENGSPAVCASLATDQRGLPRPSPAGSTCDIGAYESSLRPVPTLLTLGPNAAAAGGLGFVLVVTGTHFVNDSIVRWDGADQTTTYVDSTRLAADVPAAAIASVRVALITVATPGGSTSEVMPFYVTQNSVGVPISDSSSGTNPTATTGPTGVTATGTGTGTLSVAIYSSNPAGAATFRASGAYVDVHIASGSSLTSLTVDICHLQGGKKVYWWNGSHWVAVSNQSYNTGTGCVTITVTGSTSPNLSQLTGTPFGVEEDLHLYLPFIRK